VDHVEFTTGQVRIAIRVRDIFQLIYHFFYFIFISSNDMTDHS